MDNAIRGATSMTSERDTRAKIVEQQHEDDPYQSTTRWMVEVGRRRAPHVARRQQPADAGRQSTAKPKPSLFGIRREIYLFGVLVAVYLNYYFMQVVTTIETLPSVIVFVRHAGLG